GYLAAWRPRAGRGPVRVTVLPVGGAEAGNVAVESVWLAASPAVRGQASEAVARVRNHGPTAQVNVPLALLVDGRPVGSQTVTVPAGGATDVKFAVQFDAAGSHLLSAVAAVAGGGGVASDDRADAAVDAVEPVRVLVVSGDERADQPMRGESDFLRVALAPYAAARRPGPDPAAVTVAADASDWAGELARHQVLILANTAAPTDAPVRAIEQFAYDGGGVLIAPGSLASADAYNAALYRDGGGILPASLAAPTPADGSAATTVLGLDLADPLLQFLRGKPDPIPSATVGRHFPAAPRADARVLASYASGHPFAVAAAWGRGRVLLVTTPLDADWSTLPLSSFYLPFVQSAVRELTGPRAAERNVPPGRPLVYATDAPIDRAAATLALPDGTREALPVTQLGRRNEVRYAAAGQPGVYRLQFKSAGHDRTVHFVVQPPAGESDLTPLTDERWRQVEDALPMARVDVEREQVSRAVTGRRDGRELWGPLLVGVLALVAVETVLGRLWSGGD
ncbi:MAG TPA: CARDB domain-containing protein, partial [Tepidisphaeraceae bacterium]|nr:CARDB domain-containing protein [Tepidisphaeraceae bacterium]